MRRVLYRPNSTVLSCCLNAPNYISSRKSAGKLKNVLKYNLSTSTSTKYNKTVIYSNIYVCFLIRKNNCHMPCERM